MGIPQHVIRKQILNNIKPTIHQAALRHYLWSRNNDLSKGRTANQKYFSSKILQINFRKSFKMSNPLDEKQSFGK